MKRILIILLISLLAIPAFGARVQVNNVPATISNLIVNLTSIFTPSAAQVIDAVGDTILANATIIELNPDANHTLTSTPHIADGTEGQILIITTDPAEGNTVTLQDQGTLGGSNILLLNSIASRAIGAGSSITFRFDSGDWKEIFYNGSLDISTDTNLVGGTNITLSDDTLNVDDAFLVNDASDTMIGDLTLNNADPALIFDPATADTEFYIAINEDAGGDDDDTVAVGKGTTPGTTQFFIWDKDGGFIAQNLTDAVTAYKFMDSNGGTSVLNIDTTNERAGLDTDAPDAKLHISDAAQGSILRFENRDTTIITNQVLGAIEFEGQDTSTNASGVRAKISANAEANNGATGIRFFTTKSGDTTLNEIARMQSDGSAFFQSSTDSTTGFQLLDADGGAPVFNSNTTDEQVYIGTASSDEKFAVFDGNIEVYDSNDLASESLDEVDFATHASWDDVGDFDSESGNAAYTHSGGTGTLTQTSGNMAIAGVGSRWYKFTYTVSAVTETGTLAATITTAFAASAVTLTVDTAATDTVYFQSTASPGNFIISATSDTGGDTFTIDDVTLKEIIGGDMIVNGLITGGGTLGIKVLANGNVVHGAGTNHDGYVIRPGAELQTGNAAQQTLDRFTLADNNTYLVKASVAGFEDGASYAGYEIIATVRRDGGGATILGGVTSVHTTETVGAWDATFTVNSNDVRVSVTGEAATTIEWSCTMRYMNVGI